MTDAAEVRKRPEILSIQYLRAAAAIAVVIFHLTQTESWLHHIGKYGVDMFFVISGFIMVVMTKGQSIKPIDFAIDRITRIVPSYWFATIAAFVVALLGLHFHNPSKDLIFLATSLLFIPAKNIYGEIQPTLYLGWTLNFEMFFYGIFSFALLFRKSRTALVCLILTILFVIGMFLSPSSALMKTYTSPLLLEFAAGAVLGEIFGLQLDRFSPQYQLIYGLLVAVVLALFGVGSPSLVFGSASVVIITVGLLIERRGLMPNIRGLRVLGSASFAIYLYQEFAFGAVGAVLKLSGVVRTDHGISEALIKAIYLMTAIGTGLLILKFVERPMTAAARSMRHRGICEPAQIVKPAVT
jgi:exopolysaccharide production protein ExoZ